MLTRQSDSNGQGRPTPPLVTNYYYNNIKFSVL